MRKVLNDEAQAGLTTKLQLLPQFGTDDLNQTRRSANLTPPKHPCGGGRRSFTRATRDQLFAPSRDDVNDVTLQLSDFSTYININAVETYIWETKQVDPPTINIDGAVRLGPVVFEGDVQVGQRVGAAGDEYNFQRKDARLVYDQPEEYRRFFLGDLDPKFAASSRSYRWAELASCGRSAGSMPFARLFYNPIDNSFCSAT